MDIITKHLLMSYCLFLSVESQSNRPPTVNSVNTFFTAFENATIGSLIYRFNATDPDNDVLTFSAGSSDTDSLVNVTQLSSSGNIYTCGLVLKTQLDRDNSPSVRQLHVKIKDLLFEITYKILMIINDVNDNPPTFTGLPYRFSLLENTTLLTPVFIVSATDPDTGSGGQIFYSMNASSSQDDADYNETFSLTSNTGIIHLKRKLDYETKSFYHFKVYSRDNGNPMCPSVACICTASPDVCRGDPVDLFITIIDVEDTPPVFDGLPYITTIYENQLLGTSVIQLKATDGDRGVPVPNKVQYTITDGNTDTDFPFSIDLMNDTIVVSKILDADNLTVRSRGGLYLFTVTATEVNGTGQFDPSVSVSSTHVSITVFDVNDNLPEFKQGTYSATVPENTPKGAPLLMSSTIEVEDIDQTGNNMFSVVIKKDGASYTDFSTLPDENQTINGRSSITIIVVNSSVLDYEVRKNITFQLVAEALNGTEFITNLTSVTVSLQITDVNDNSPYFPSQATHFNVPENASVGTVVTQVNASDLDSGDYGTITFSLEDSETAFSINNQTGKLFVNSLLDRETRAVYNLAILATDSPLHLEAERRRSRLQININVTDVNDNAPEWAQSVPYVTVLESTTVGTNITQLLAADRDEGLNGQIVFSIAPNTNGSTLFNVMGDNGKAFISVKKSLVNNVGPQTVIVVASDRGSPPLSSNVTISILVVDENQNKPVFVVPDQSAFNESTGKIPEIVIDEEIPPGSFLIQLSATDADQGLNGLVFYYLDFTLGEGSEYFRVDRVSGNMTSVKRLNREKQGIYEIRVKAEDNGQPASLSTSLPIRVRLQDIDDNSPTYDKVTMPQTMFVTEEMSPVSMGNITPATDIDLYPNNINCYYLYGGDNLTSFTLNKTTGNLTLIHKVDREKIQFMDIVIQASENCNESSMTSVDSMNPSFNYNSSDSSLLYVRVKVIDINDNPPKFVSTLLSTAVINDIDLGTEVMTLAGSVTDADTPENSRNLFRLLNITLKNDDTVLDTNKQAFVVTVNGSVVTNIRYRSDIVGYFSLFVEAYDERIQKDVAEIRIFVISNLQRVRLVFNRLPNQVEETKIMFIKELSDVLKLDLVMDKVVTHTSIDGVQDPTKTDAFIHGRELSTLNVVSASELSRRFDYDQNARTVLYKYGVGEARALTTDSTDTSNEDLKRTFAIVAAVLAIAMVSLVLVLIHLVRMYRHRLRAATTMAYSSPKEQELFEPPGTNKYYSAENPLFGKEIKPALLEDDKVSNSSLDDNVVDTNTQIPEAPNEPEEQEVVLQISESPAASPGHKKDLNHNPHLDEVLETYQNKGFDDDDEPDSRLGQSGRSDRLKPASHSHNRPKIPEAPEGVTKFSENFLSYDTGYQNINYSTSGRGHVDYTDI